MPDEQVSRTEFEAGLIRQEHRTFYVLTNFWEKRSLDKADPRRKAAVHAFLYWLATFFITGAVGTGTMLALIGIAVAMWGNVLTRDYHAFEQDQRAAEMTLALDSLWNNAHTPENRRRLGRLFRIYDNIPNQSAQDDFLDFLLPTKPEFTPTALRENPHVMELIHYEVDSDHNDDAELLNAVSEYKGAIISVCNVMESVAVVRTHTRSEAAKHIIDASYRNTISDRTRRLRRFIALTQESSPTSWRALIELVERGEWKVEG